MRLFLLVVFIGISILAQTQERATVYGKITDERGKPMELVNVAITGLPGGTSTDTKGRYELEIPSNKEVYIGFSFIGYQKEIEKVVLGTGEKKQINKTLKSSATNLPQVEVEDEQIRTSNLKRIDPKLATRVVSASD